MWRIGELFLFCQGEREVERQERKENRSRLRGSKQESFSGLHWWVLSVLICDQKCEIFSFLNFFIVWLCSFFSDPEEILFDSNVLQVDNDTVDYLL